jgi:dimethylamine/trimethylamine dehydrogenase
LISHFLSPVTNTRSDEYGGSLVNRVRLLRELIEETKEAVGDRCAVAVRFAADEGGGEGGGEDSVPVHGERREMFQILAELPDLWDINIQDYSYEMGVSRFVKEAALEPYMDFVKSVTSKPVVTVGRFTSPDTMLSQVNRGIVDFIGAARPSIADPFLPRKIEEGRSEDIRECIGCNICYVGDQKSVPIRCTQNPTMGEEWRRGWHPEKIADKGSDAKVLVVGAGPAGLECARALGQRGYDVMLAEARRELGGRVTMESRLPGLAEWARVRDYRLQQIGRLPNVEVYRESKLSADDVLAVGADHVVIATGAIWRRDGFGRSHPAGIADIGPAAQIFTPDDVMAGRLPEGRVVVFDDDFYYMAAVISERIRAEGVPVVLVTSNDMVAAWGTNTAEQTRSQRRLLELGVEIVTAQVLLAFDGQAVVLRCTYTGRERRIEADSLVMVTARRPKEDLYRELSEQIAAGVAGTPKSLRRIGDCEAPAIIAAAVHAGHSYARELDTSQCGRPPIRRDRAVSSLDA